MNLFKPPNINYAWAELIIEELVRNGVTYFCIAPGSRSSPLTYAAAAHSGTKTLVHFDERGMGFHAMGHVSISRKPVALICSSGTAVANLFPAIIEASKKKLPLLIFSADRPPELQFTGAMQTIDQVKIYGAYVRWHTCLPTPSVSIKPEVLLTTIDQAVFRSLDPMPGPVHINCMYREPLSPKTDNYLPDTYFSTIKEWLRSDKVYTFYSAGTPKWETSEKASLISIINKTRRGIIVVGKLKPREQKYVIELAEKLNWPIFPDIVSGLRNHLHPHIINYYDQLLLSEAFAIKFPIDTVLHLGGRITSKRWYQFMDAQRPKNYITVLNHSLRNDPLHMVTFRIKAKVGEFSQYLLPHTKSAMNEEFFSFLQNASKKINDILNEQTIEKMEFNEINITRIISRLIPNNHGLFLSNSMPVREMDMYSVPLNKTMVIGGNRGASGIDGIIATASGFAGALNEMTTLLIGDLACLHDLNSLSLIKKLEVPMVIVIINNYGGGIFSFLPINETISPELFNQYFATEHQWEFSKVASMFGLMYENPLDLKSFSKSYQKTLLERKSSIIEVKVQRDTNYKAHLNLQKIISQAIDNMLK